MNKLKLFFTKLSENFNFDSFLISILIIKIIIFDASWVSAIVLFMLLADPIVRRIIGLFELKHKINESLKEYADVQSNIIKEVEDLKTKVNRTNTEFNLYRSSGRK